jgi:hypothetical protein
MRNEASSFARAASACRFLPISFRASAPRWLQTSRGRGPAEEHNDANVLVLGGAKTGKPLAQEILEIWLETPFVGGRHQRRIDKIARLERELGARIHIKDGERD